MEQNQNQHGVDYHRALHVVPRGQIIVPQGHGNVHKLFAGTEIRNKSAVISDIVTPTQSPQALAKSVAKAMPARQMASQAAASTPKYFDDVKKIITRPVVRLNQQPAKPIAKAASIQHFAKPAPVVQNVVKQMPIQAQPVAKTSAPVVRFVESDTPAMAFSPFDPLPVDLAEEARKLAKQQKRHKASREPAVKHDKVSLAQRAELLREKRAASRAAKADAKATARADKAAQKQTQLENEVKLAALDTTPAESLATTQVLAAAVASEPAELDSSTERVLTSAATIDDTAQPAHVASLSNNTAAVAALPRPSFIAKAANMPRITFTFKVNAAKLFAALRVIAILLILAVSGYLAWDTWMTNRTVEETFSNPASAMSIDSTNPATADPTSISNQQWSSYTVPADQPRYIYIPSIGVQARVMNVGVTSKGNIDTPKNLNDTAWYDGSAKPNQPGEVFIDGHTSFNTSLAAAFNALPKLQKGAEITIETGDGTKVNYQVVASETVAASSVNMDKALNTPNGATKGLTLMTCAGTFNYRTQEASERYIVYAVQE